MKYIGTSLGRCLTSLMAGEVSEDDVMFIVTRTLCPDYDTFMDVVKEYYEDGSPVGRILRNLNLGSYDFDKVKDLASRLYFTGKIHQPRVYAHQGGDMYSHPAQYGHGLWMEVVPTNRNSTPAVIEAYEKYRMLDMLTK